MYTIKQQQENKVAVAGLPEAHGLPGRRLGFQSCLLVSPLQENKGQSYTIKWAAPPSPPCTACPKSTAPPTALQVCTQEFSRDRKMMSVLCASAEGATMFVKGAPEAVLAACTSVRQTKTLGQFKKCRVDSATLGQLSEPTELTLRRQLQGQHSFDVGRA